MQAKALSEVFAEFRANLATKDDLAASMARMERKFVLSSLIAVPTGIALGWLITLFIRHFVTG